MAALNPKHLLEQAERLIEPRSSSALIRQADRRRAISSAYYAAFYMILTATADEFVDKAKQKIALYALVYRSVDHKALESLCKIASREQLSEKYARFAPHGGFGVSIREFSALIFELKEKRTSADYDPSHWFKIEDARTAIATAHSAIAQFENVLASKRKAFLTLLLFPPR